MCREVAEVLQSRILLRLVYWIYLLKMHDFAQLNDNTYYVYNDIENFNDEPHLVRIHCEEDIHVTEEVYKRPVFLLPSYR